MKSGLLAELEYYINGAAAKPEKFSFESTGDLQWHICLSLLGVCLILMGWMAKNAELSGKIYRVTAILPIPLLIILLIRAGLLEGNFAITLLNGNSKLFINFRKYDWTEALI